ncbi:hypothetical protein EKH77_29190 [Streptomyces luteoverticillatus]|uniref:Uncharacterized protein n=1 Tax=Streptomyces luteoverticillatus TaxID=66425 RepID=A0A3S9PR27_STRLT|nr:hypothetical protein [Streptomyces luteoverticillatus]AZQ74738.1 hypothetical protein EKH77_29190 [Streptomyces luteoverticillatus]
MAVAAVANRTAPGTWSDFGCEVNAIPPAELFDRYERSRFLYPAKRARLAPYWPLILENWKRARRAGELLHWVASYDEPDGGWASLTSWRSTHTGWQIQHLVSSGTLAGGRAVMLAAQAAGMAERQHGAAQNWFSPSNRFAALAFGTIAHSLGPEHSLVAPGDYVMVPLALAHALGAAGAAGTVVELDGGACPELAELARYCRGEVYVRAEGLDRDDLRLTDVDRLYRLVGLRRHRRVWALYDTSGTVRAAALAYRGPLGFNFSFLENRCDLLIAPDLDAAEARRATDTLLAAARDAYADFEPAAVPLTTATPVGHLILAGAEPVRPYTRALWLAEAYPDFYRHIDELYARRLNGRGAHPRSNP